LSAVLELEEHFLEEVERSSGRIVREVFLEVNRGYAAIVAGLLIGRGIGAHARVVG
jgi:hypothetical protein